MDKEEALKKIESAFAEINAFEAAMRSSRRIRRDTSDSDSKSLSTQEISIASE